MSLRDFDAGLAEHAYRVSVRCGVEEAPGLNTTTQGMQLSPEEIVDSVREAIIILDDSMRVISANRSFYCKFEVSAEQTEGRLIYELGNGQWNIPQLRHLLETVIPLQTNFENFEVRHRFEQLGERVMRLNARRLLRGGGKPGLVLLAIDDITDAYTTRVQLEKSEAKYRKFVEEINSIIISFSDEGLITFINEFGARIFGYRRDELLGKPFVGTIIPIVESNGRDNSHIATEIFIDPPKYYANENEGVRKDGTRVRFTWNAKAVRDASGVVS
ncbi:MAG: PAS domain S-box protein, partial [Chitinivibrionales bacterium]|nr:PAS domain S-box protein [Chitinivibrionales bacterium]